MIYKKQLDWPAFLLGAFWLAVVYFEQGGEAQRCRVECAAVHNGFASFCIIRLLFPLWKFVKDVKPSSFIRPKAVCFGSHRRYSEVLHDLIQGGGKVCHMLSGSHQFSSSVDRSVDERDINHRSSREIRQRGHWKGPKIAVDQPEKKAVFFRCEIVLRSAYR